MNNRLRFSRLISSLEGPARKAFLNVIDNLVDSIMILEIEDAIRRGDPARIVHLLELRPENAVPIMNAFSEGFVSGGEFTLNDLPKERRRARGRGDMGEYGLFHTPTARPARGNRIKVYFNGRSERAEKLIMGQAEVVIREINKATNGAIREALQYGMERGWNPRKTALDIAGRIDPATGRRAGGLIGLTEHQASYVTNMRSDLSGVIDAKGWARYKGRTRRDRRFDGVVERAYRNGTPLSQKEIDRITGRYSDRLLQMRAETIARTEMTNAANAGRDEGIDQLIETGNVENQFVTKRWVATSDDRTRDHHADLDGTTIPWDEAFESGSGGRMMHPGDGSLGAGPEDIINCRCWMEINVDWIEQRREERAMEAEFG